jgi:hypothetical protein
MKCPARTSLSAAAFAFACLLPTGARGAEEQKAVFQNLQVLPPDISREALMDLMRFEFVGGLGVRCTHCHVGTEGRPLSEYDFPSDSKPAKRTARSMLRMTRQINEQFLAGLEERGDPPVRVQCVTCHRGQTRPRLIQDVLHRAIVQQGVEAAVAEYRRLRQEYLGSHTFDFGRTALTQLARTLATEGRAAEAVAILELNVEMHTDYWYSHVLLADHLAPRERDRAVRHLERALVLAPEDSKPFVAQRLEELRAPAPPAEP